MNLPDLGQFAALWLGLRQMEALREPLKASINSCPFPMKDLRSWIATQGVEVDDETPEPQLITVAMANGFWEGVGFHPDVLVRGSNAPAADWVDLGAERSGAGWSDPANFIITSAFVRLLGAWEQFELDVLKALFYYRAQGLLGHPEDQVEIVVEPEVIREVPRVSNEAEVYMKPPIWTWLRKSAENNVERARIYKRVFDISTLPKAESGKRRDQWYEKRNQIAHGRKGVSMTLGDYIEVEVFIALAMIHVSEQCLKKFKLRV